MRLIQRLKNLRKAWGMTSSDLERMLTMGGGTASGVSVNEDTAMRISTVYSCVNALARSLAQLPCHLFQQAGDIKNKALQHSLYPILHDQPNEWMTSFEFWGMAMAHLCLRGNFYALKNRGISKTGPLRELIPFGPDMVQKVVQDANYQLTYTVRYPDSSLHEIPGSEIMHLRGLTLNGFMGLSPISYVRECFGLALATEEFGARFFGNGTHPGMIVEHPNQLSPTAHTNLQNSLAEKYSGLGRAHRMMILEEGMKAHNVTVNPEDSQFLETRKFQKAEIVDIFFSMPLTIINSGDSPLTNASTEQFSLGYVIYALTPWMASIEKSIRRDLLTDAEKAQNYYAKFSAGALLRGDFKTRMEGYQIGINTEIFSPNEARDLEDMNPYAGGEVYRTRTSTVKEPAGPAAPKKGDTSNAA